MKSHRLGRAGIGFVMALAAGSAMATNVGYNYAGLQYLDQNLDDYDCSQDGLALYGSHDIDGSWFARGALSDVGGDEGCGSTRVAVGGGYRALFNDIFDIYGTLSLENIAPDAGDSDTGLVVAGGFRGYIGDSLEGRLELSRSTAFDGETTLTAGAVYWFTERVAATADLGLSGDVTSVGIGARMTF